MMKTLIVSFLLLSLVYSCDDKKTDTESVVSTNDTIVKNDGSDTSTKNPKGGATLHGITVSQYMISREDLASQYSKDKKLIIIKTHFSDLSVPTSLKPRLYPAKNHKDHAQGTNELSGVSAQGTTSIETTNMTIGNNYFKVKDILKKNGSDRRFTYLLLKPNTIRFPGHLVYQLTAVTVNGALFDEEDLGYSNPSPPAPPLEN